MDDQLEPLMGLVDGLTRPELRDLIRFLSELGKPGPYRAAPAAIVRAWQVLSPVPGEMANAYPSPPAALHGAPPAEPDSSWLPRYSTVAGGLPIAVFDDALVALAHAWDLPTDLPPPGGVHIEPALEGPR